MSEPYLNFETIFYPPEGDAMDRYENYNEEQKRIRDERRLQEYGEALFWFAIFTGAMVFIASLGDWGWISR